MGGTVLKSKEDFGVHNFFGVDLHGASIGVAFLIILAIAIFGMFCCFINNACRQWVFGRSAMNRQSHRQHPWGETTTPTWPQPWPAQSWPAPQMTWPMYPMMTMGPPPLPPATIQEIPNEATRVRSGSRPGNSNV